MGSGCNAGRYAPGLRLPAHSNMKGGEMFERTFINFQKTMDSMNAEMNELFQSSGNETKVQTENMNIKIVGKEVVINGDVEKITLNGKRL